MPTAPAVFQSSENILLSPRQTPPERIGQKRILCSFCNESTKCLWGASPSSNRVYGRKYLMVEIAHGHECSLRAQSPHLDLENGGGSVQLHHHQKPTPDPPSADSFRTSRAAPTDILYRVGHLRANIRSRIRPRFSQAAELISLLLRVPDQGGDSVRAIRSVDVPPKTIPPIRPLPLCCLPSNYNQGVTQKRRTLWR